MRVADEEARPEAGAPRSGADNAWGLIAMLTAASMFVAAFAVALTFMFTRLGGLGWGVRHPIDMIKERAPWRLIQPEWVWRPMSGQFLEADWLMAETAARVAVVGLIALFAGLRVFHRRRKHRLTKRAAVLATRLLAYSSFGVLAFVAVAISGAFADRWLALWLSIALATVHAAIWLAVCGFLIAPARHL